MLATKRTPLFSRFSRKPPYFRRVFDGGGGGSQTEPAKIGTAAPYFLKVPFEASHLSLGNENIISYFRRISDFFS